jgi:hypothetical protein
MNESKSLLVSGIIMLLLAFPSSSNADIKKLDPFLKITKTAPQTGKLLLGKAVSLEGTRENIACLLKSTNPELTAEALEEIGGETRAIVGDIMSVSIPAELLDPISDRDEVVYIEAAKLLTPKMNAARAFSNVDKVQAGIGLDKAYAGANVLVGVVDSDLDWQNDDFAGTDGTTRICYINQRTSSTSVVECSKQTIDNNSCQATRGGIQAHGTHVTGIAASSNNVYTGIAPEAFIAFAFNAPEDPDTSGSFSTTVLEGVNAIFTKADSLSLPSVINISLGTSIGAHDNTSLLEQGLNNAVAGKKGRVIVNAAGNENLNTGDPDYMAGLIGGIHAPINVDSQDTGWGIALRAVNNWNYFSYALADLWLADTTNCRNATLEVKAYPQTVYTGFKVSNQSFFTAPIDFTTDKTNSATSGDGKVKVQVYTYTSNPQNSRPEGVVLITPASTGSWADVYNNYFFDVVIRPSGSCTGDMWLYPDQTAMIDFMTLGPQPVADATEAYTLQNGDSNKTTTIPGTASGVITAGSYMGRASWVDIDGATQYQTDPYGSVNNATGGTVNNISLFSSLGPTGDGRTKPDIVAPGEPIISTKGSSYSTGNRTILANSTADTHLKLEGTSMSSPYVAGIVALLLEKNNCLTVDQVRTALTSTATSTGGNPNNTYGYGKVNALAAMQSITADTSCYTGTSCGSGGNGGGGGGGCGGTIVPVSTSVGIASVLALLVPFGILCIRRKKH